MEPRRSNPTDDAKHRSQVASESHPPHPVCVSGSGKGSIQIGHSPQVPARLRSRGALRTRSSDTRVTKSRDWVRKSGCDCGAVAPGLWLLCQALADSGTWVGICFSPLRALCHMSHRKHLITAFQSSPLQHPLASPRRRWGCLRMCSELPCLFPLG